MNVACAVPDSILKDPVSLEYSWNAKGSVEELENIRRFPEWLRRLYKVSVPNLTAYFVL